MTTRKRCNREHLIQHTCIRSRASSRHYTFEACIFGADRVRCGVGEVDVLGMVVVEVVVHGDGSGSSGTCLGEGLDESEFFGAIGYPVAL